MEDNAKRWHSLPRGWREVAAENEGSVLLETARFDTENYRSFLFSRPIRVVAAVSPDQIPTLFHEVEKATAEGLYVAGYLNYECGYHFQSLEKEAHTDAVQPMTWFGIFEAPLIFDHESGEVTGDAAWISQNTSHAESAFSLQGFSLTLSREEYRQKIAAIQKYIAAGDTYQVNFTDLVTTSTDAGALDIYSSRLTYQPVSYAALVRTESVTLLSFSPELFFRIQDGKISTRPMKGTMPRGLNGAEDEAMAAKLSSDEKNCAEHVMIVDLLRNDLGRVCEMGSVHVKDLFSIEKYRTLFQMTSTVSGRLLPEIGYYKIFSSLFPSGSVTGAPKIRTMQIIRELERRSRGIYTGCIGYVAPDGSSAFNVAIRTLAVREEDLTLGIGGGIVADSSAEDEYNECVLKANFLVKPSHAFRLIETILWNGNFTFLEMHLDRLGASASYFDFRFDRASVNSRLKEEALRFSSGTSYRVRLLLDLKGELEISAMRHEAGSNEIRILVATERTASGDVFLRHKTTQRDLYDRLYQNANQEGFDEVLFLNERSEVTEGAISNVFVLAGDRMLTPPAESGVLPGVYRRHLLETNSHVEESVLTMADLENADAVFLANSIRGLRRVVSWSSDRQKVN